MALEQIGLQAVLDDKNFQAGLSRYTKGIGQMTSLTDGAAKVLSGAFVAATGVAVAGIGAVVAASKIGLDATLQWAEGLDKLGDQFGMSGEVASGWQFLMQKVGLSVDEGAQGLNYFTKQLDDFGKATKTGQVTVTPFMTALQKLGVNAYDARGKLKTFDEIMPQIMDQFQKLPAGIDASALAMDLFGARGGTKFLDFLRQGGKGLKDATTAAKALGLELSTDEVNAAEEFGFAMNELNLGLLGVKNTIGRAVLPVAKQFVDWINRNAIPKIAALAQRYIPLFSKALDALGDILGDLTSGRGLNALFRFYYLLEDTFGRDTAKKIYDVMTAVGRFKDEIAALAGRLQDAFKRGGLAGLGGQIASELQKAWPAISAQLSTWGVQFWNWLTGPGGAISQAQAKIQEFANKIGPALAAAWPVVSKQFTVWGTSFWDWLTGKGGTVEQTAAKISEVVENLLYSFGTLWDSVIAPALKKYVPKFWEWVTGKGGVIETIASNMEELTKKIREWAEGPGAVKFEEIGEGIATTIITGIGNLFSGDQTKSDSAMNKLVDSLTRAKNNLLAAFGALGASIGAGIVLGIASAFVSPAQIETIRAALNNGIIAAVAAWASGNHQPLIDMIINAILGQWHPTPAPTPPIYPGFAQFQKGGWVNKTELALVHRGEYIIPARQAQSIVNHNTRSIGAVTVTIQGSTGMGEAAIKRAVYQGITEVLGAA